MRGVPDSRLCTEAMRIAMAALSVDMFNHSMRTYHLAAAYGEKTMRPHSPEELFLSSIFHDMGLYSPYAIKGKPFQVGSSQALKECLLKEGGVAPVRVNAMMEAIDFHFQLRPRWDRGPLAGLLQVGAYMDVLGGKSSSIDREFRREVLRKYPKKRFFLEFNVCLLRSFSGPGSVIGILRPGPYCGRGHYIDLQTA